MFLDLLIDRIVDYREYDPPVFLGVHGTEQCGQSPHLAARGKEILEDITESQRFLDVYRDVLQAPTLENVTEFFTSIINSGYRQDDMQELVHAAIRLLAVHDAGSRDIDGCTTTEAFLGNQEIVHTAFMHMRSGIGVTAIAKEKGIARSTVYDQLGRFAAWPAKVQETMLDCMTLFGGEKFDPEAAPVALDAC
jgi:hypothetical protein